MNIRKAVGAAEYPALVRIWRSAVDATHDFLSDSDRESIEARLPSDYFPAVALWVAERDGRPIAFSGVADNRLEMLFVAAEERGSGAGTALLAHAVREVGASTIDVTFCSRAYVRSRFLSCGLGSTGQNPPCPGGVCSHEGNQSLTNIEASKIPGHGIMVTVDLAPESQRDQAAFSMCSTQ